MGRHGLVEQAPKLEPFLMAVSFLTKAVDRTIGRIQRGEQSRRAVTFVVMGHGLAATALERQSRLGAIQSLNLAFLVYAQHQSMFGRVQIQADDVLQFFRELGTVADFEALHPMWFQPVTAPDAANAGF